MPKKYIHNKLIPKPQGSEMKKNKNVTLLSHKIEEKTDQLV